MSPNLSVPASLCCHARPGSDWRLWKARVLNIICGCCLAMTISWLVLPWYASDEHLAQLSDAYTAAGKLVQKFYDTFHATGKAAAEVRHRMPGGLSLYLVGQNAGFME